MNEDQTLNGEVNDGNGSDDQATVTIDGVEMTATEAKELIENGKTFKQLQSENPNVDFKEMPKAFTQARQQLAELQKMDKKEASGQDLSDKDIKRKKEIQEFFSDPDVQEELSKITGNREKELKEDLAFQKTLEDLEAEYDGKDGRPKFNRVEVLKYGQENNIFNPRAAYKQLHEDALVEWRVNEKINRKRPTTHFERRPGQGDRQPDVKAASSFQEATDRALADDQ